MVFKNDKDSQLFNTRNGFVGSFGMFVDQISMIADYGTVFYNKEPLFDYDWGRITKIHANKKFFSLAEKTVKVMEFHRERQIPERFNTNFVIVAIGDNKFGAKKNIVDGITFDSQKEAERWQELKALEKAGKIHALERQAKYLLIPKRQKDDGSFEKPVYYVADFVYRRSDTKPMENDLVVEDVKGLKKGAAYQVYVLKRKMMLYRYGIEIKEL